MAPRGARDVGHGVLMVAWWARDFRHGGFGRGRGGFMVPRMPPRGRHASCSPRSVARPRAVWGDGCGRPARGAGAYLRAKTNGCFAVVVFCGVVGPSVVVPLDVQRVCADPLLREGGSCLNFWFSICVSKMAARVFSQRRPSPKVSASGCPSADSRGRPDTIKTSWQLAHQNPISPDFPLSRGH